MTIFWIVLALFTVNAAILVYLWLEIVKTGYISVVFRLGKFNRVLKEGPHLVFYPFERVEKHSTHTHHAEFPAEPEWVDRTNDAPDEGKKLPMRIPFTGMDAAIFYVRKNYSPESELTANPFDNTLPFSGLKKVQFSELPPHIRKAMQEDSLNLPLTGEIQVVLQWHIKAKLEQSIRDLIQNVSPQTGIDREIEINKRAEDLIDSILQAYLAPTTFFHAVYIAPVLSALIKEQLEIAVGEKPKTPPDPDDKPWGIHIGKAYIRRLHPGFTVNNARSQAAAADSLKQAAIREAEGRKQAAILDAEGQDQVIRKLADAKAYEEKKAGEGVRDRINMIKAAVSDDRALAIMQTQAAERILPYANATIVPSDLGALAGILRFGEGTRSGPGGGGPTPAGETPPAPPTGAEEVQARQ